MNFDELERKVNEAVAERDGQISLLSQHLAAAKTDLAAAEEKEAAAKSALDGAALVAAQTERDAAQKTVELVRERLDALSRGEVAGKYQLVQALREQVSEAETAAAAKIGALLEQMEAISAALDSDISRADRLARKAGGKVGISCNSTARRVVKAARKEFRR
ncbi:MAG: hypothetical protein LUE89_00440 [Clostridiales bacterium]|nr:hypothetical protein [Clostridiales bacterium]